VRPWLIAICVLCCFSSVAQAQKDAPEDAVTEEREVMKADEKANPSTARWVKDNWKEGAKNIHDAMPEPSSIGDGLTAVVAEVLWTAKMALIGIVIVLALAVLGKIFTFMHK
jgi:hypothetical protein